MNTSPLIQRLESRRHLSVTLDDGTLIVTGTRRSDSAMFAIYRGEFHVRVNGRDFLFRPEQVERISIRTGRGNDQVTFGASGGGTPKFPANFAGDGDQLADIAVPLTLVLGAGDDYAVAVAGSSRVFGGPGNDILHSLAGPDFLDGGEGDDVLTSDEGNDTLMGGDGRDMIQGGQDNDSLVGGSDNDTIMGGSGQDVLRGETGNDQLEGGSDADTLFGGAGNDRLNGTEGVDALFGGRAGDIFHDTDEARERKDFSFGDELVLSE
jgi:Ca2+-binding RTX toxin-like protein